MAIGEGGGTVGVSGDGEEPARPLRFGLWYDFRNPDRWAVPYEHLYAETLEQISWAEDLGYRSVWISEHHFAADGYTPSPLVLAAAIAARTSEMIIGTSVMVAPLHDPVRLAEDSAALAILSAGRFNLGVAIGYREEEFAAFGLNLKNRPSLLEESAEIVKRAWRGESIEFAGKRFNYPDLKIAPTPPRPPKLLVGGMRPAAIERAARIGDGFLSTRNDHWLPYLEAVAAIGGDPATRSIHAGQWAIVAADPERTWDRIGDHALYQINKYIEWGSFGPPDKVSQLADRQGVLDIGAFTLWDTAAAVEELTTLLAATPQVEDVFFWGRLPGEPAESGAERIEFLMREVVPAVRKRLAARD